MKLASDGVQSDPLEIYGLPLAEAVGVIRELAR
jgi:hypothetical protein